MIIAWVLSLLLILATMLAHLERLLTLESIALHTYEQSASQFIASEKSLIECEKNLSNMKIMENDLCHVRSVGKNLWLISSKQSPHLEVLVFLDDQTHLATRLNWRQVFD